MCIHDPFVYYLLLRAKKSCCNYFSRCSMAHFYLVWLFTLFAVFLLCREASNSILHFLADIFDLANSSMGELFIPIRDSVIIPRGASITRILVASLTGALPKSRVDVVISQFLTQRLLSLFAYVPF